MVGQHPSQDTLICLAGGPSLTCDISAWPSALPSASFSFGIQATGLPRKCAVYRGGWWLENSSPFVRNPQKEGTLETGLSS
eukprot:12908251-Prorocentrum_lima.AAC.1